MLALNGQWMTRDKRVLKISEMGTMHIINCIKMLERQIEQDDAALIAATSFPVDTIAGYYASHEVDEACIRSAWCSAAIREFKAELRRRP